MTAPEHWSDEEWEGRARMAAARLDAGRISRRGPFDEEGNRPVEWDTDPLDDLDREALARYPRDDRGVA
ncbi:MAG TPA: hypothetical protein VGW74_08845 [Propionibacteriaceae bacterium]|nr:hypothetical protein [Propionibacteriaceae bacterium]